MASSAGGIRSAESGGPEQVESLLKVIDSFKICPALKGSLSRAMPVRNRLRSEPRFRVVMRDQLRLSLHHLGELNLEHAGNALVQHSAPLQQRRARRDLL